tara:strand:+ start:142 stop:273 length:132 start_codon:yes stop_codon:yes gene_type:complete
MNIVKALVAGAVLLLAVGCSDTGEISWGSSIYSTTATTPAVGK